MLLMSLWLPILLSAVAVFIASSVIHMVLKYHNTDFKRLPDEEGVLSALRPFQIAPGEYSMPHCTDMEAMKDPAYMEKLNAGPVAFMTVIPNGRFNMGPQLVQWFLFSVLVGVFCGYIVGGLGGAGMDYRTVFQFVSATAFACYFIGMIPSAIWFKKSWSTVVKNMIDCLVYALLTGGFFGWLWPAA